MCNMACKCDFKYENIYIVYVVYVYMCNIFYEFWGSFYIFSTVL